MKKVFFKETDNKKMIYKDPKNFVLLGLIKRYSLKKKLALTKSNFSFGLSQNAFVRLQELIKKNPLFKDQEKIKEEAIIKIKKSLNYKNTRITRGLPLRGQRTRTNAQTRKKRNVL